MSPFRRMDGYLYVQKSSDISALPRPRGYPAGCGKERSAHTFPASCRTGHTAGLTVEAAFVCSLFFLCMYLFWILFPVMELEISIRNAMEEVGGRTAVSAPLLQMAEADAETADADSLPAEIVRDAAFAVYAKKKILEQTDEGLFRSAHVKGGSRGLSMGGSSFSVQGDVFLQASYRVMIPGIPGNLFTIPVCQTARRKCWTGRSEENGPGAEDEGDILVYVAATGGVYHKDPGCYHLNVTVRSVPAGAVGAARNRGGGRYRACEHCAAAAAAAGTVFITPEGDRYHVTRDCSGLKRTVRSVPLSECGLRPCSNCGK